MHISNNVFMKIHISIMPKLVLVLECNLSAAIAAWPFDIKTCYIIEKVKTKVLFFSLDFFFFHGFGFTLIEFYCAKFEHHK